MQGFDESYAIVAVVENQSRDDRQVLSASLSAPTAAAPVVSHTAFENDLTHPYRTHAYTHLAC